MRIDLVRESVVKRTARVMQLESIFDVQPSQQSAERWSFDFELPETWNVGLIVGPSGCGKSTIARELFEAEMSQLWDWPADRSVLDGFPAQMSIKEITALLGSVGFNSPPSWVRPFAVLSNGEQFRVQLARTLAEHPKLAVVDEFTSVVDRQVAQIGSAAVAKTVRRRNQQFVAVACHYDIVDWLTPDWIFEPHTGVMSRRSLRRPGIELEIVRVHHAAWSLFKRHHYLTQQLNTSAFCFCALYQGRPVAFSSWLPFFGRAKVKMRREHRTVCLPDYQGVGIGQALVDHLASMWSALGYKAISGTTHPGKIAAQSRSPHWRMTQAPSMRPKDRATASRATNRMLASFAYTGPRMDETDAVKLLAA